MNRRKCLKSVAGTPLLPSISVLDSEDEVPFDHLQSLFGENYRIKKFIADYCDTEAFGAYYGTGMMDNRPENIEYWVDYSVRNNSKNSWSVSYSTDDFAKYKYTPHSHYEAYRLCEITRNQGISSILSVISGLELKEKKLIKNFRDKI